MKFVIGIDAEIEIVLVIHHAQDGALGGRGQVIGLALFQIVDDCRLGPDRVGEIAVDFRRFARLDAGDIGNQFALCGDGARSFLRDGAIAGRRPCNARPCGRSQEREKWDDPHEAKKGDVSKERTDGIGRY